eukprot:3968890-Alexandrium_andersonii.AAC.1
MGRWPGEVLDAPLWMGLWSSSGASRRLHRLPEQRFMSTQMQMAIRTQTCETGANPAQWHQCLHVLECVCLCLRALRDEEAGA